MSDFENAVKTAAEKSILHSIAKGDWVQISYSDRAKLPEGFMADVWGMVDSEKVKQQLASRLEEELASRIVNHMAAEMATDIKQILSVKERREAIRALAREHMDAIMKVGV
jgi:hypothetical protein